MFELFLTVILNGQISAKNHIDNARFESVSQCQTYQKRMNYQDTALLKFTCERANQKTR